jgi:hypothetical protein
VVGFGTFDRVLFEEVVSLVLHALRQHSTSFSGIDHFGKFLQHETGGRQFRMSSEDRSDGMTGSTTDVDEQWSLRIGIRKAFPRVDSRERSETRGGFEDPTEDCEVLRVSGQSLESGLSLGVIVVSERIVSTRVLAAWLRRLLGVVVTQPFWQEDHGSQASVVAHGEDVFGWAAGLCPWS